MKWHWRHEVHKNQKLGKTGEPTESPETESKKKKKKNDQWKENSILEKSFILKKQETDLEGV